MKNRHVFPAITIVAVIWSDAQADQQFIQADVYDALYQAYAECDTDFAQSRSEFITEKLEHDSGQISIATLKKILKYNVDIASHEISDQSAKRGFYVSEIIGVNNQSDGQHEDRSEQDNENHKKVREIDAFLREKRKYVEVHECVLEALERSATRPK